MKTTILLLSVFAVSAVCSSQKYWKVILGDICQLPTYPRATADPTRYIECVRQSEFMSDRKDLGVWLLQECLPGYEFVASSRRCKSISSIERQQALCDSANATMYSFCPPASASIIEIEEIRQSPRQCACPNGEMNCLCPAPEILAARSVSNSTRGKRQSGQQYQNCPCPVNQPTCFCIQIAQMNQQAVASTTCCPSQQTTTTTTTQGPQYNPCACQSQQIPQPVVTCQTTSTQQQYCPTPQRDQPSVSQPQACPLVQGGTANAQYQGICSWMVDPLAVDPESRTHYLQCQPAPNNLYCGRWQRMPCPPTTIFDVNAQVCVLDPSAQAAVVTSAPGTLPPGTLPPITAAPTFTQSSCGCTGGVQIGSCNSNYQCPGQSICQVGTQNTQPCQRCCYFRKA